jgi:hypothetical protein
VVPICNLYIVTFQDGHHELAFLTPEMMEEWAMNLGAIITEASIVSRILSERDFENMHDEMREAPIK